MEEMTVWDEAMEKGAIRSSHRILLRLGRKQFGIAGAIVESELRSIQDLERLERMAEAVLTAKSWQELLATA
jgi:hypothetical protein